MKKIQILLICVILTSVIFIAGCTSHTATPTQTISSLEKIAVF